MYTHMTTCFCHTCMDRIIAAQYCPLLIAFPKNRFRIANRLVCVPNGTHGVWVVISRYPQVLGLFGMFGIFEYFFCRSRKIFNERSLILKTFNAESWLQNKTIIIYYIYVIDNFTWMGSSMRTSTEFSFMSTLNENAFPNVPLLCTI